MKRVCRACGDSSFERLIELPLRPVAHRLSITTSEEVKKYCVDLYLCKACGLIQIIDPINPELLYKDFNYNFSSWKDEPHLDDQVKRLAKTVSHESVFEIGANDGRFLALLKSYGFKNVCGVEPNPASSSIAKKQGLNIYNSWLTSEICNKAIAENNGQNFQLVVCRQVLEHLLDLDDFFNCLDILLGSSGVVMIDVPDMRPSLAVGDCSTIWEEHVNYFTLPSLRKLLISRGFEIKHNVYYDFSGGIQSILAVPTNSRETLDSREIQEDVRLCRHYESKVQHYKQQLIDRIDYARVKLGAKIVLYGVGVRACGLVNGLEISEKIDFIVDDRSERVGKYLPGTNLKVEPVGSLHALTSPVVILLAVNNENEEKVTRNLNDFMANKCIIISVCGPKDVFKELSLLT